MHWEATNRGETLENVTFMSKYGFHRLRGLQIMPILGE
jgi:hypothetical protein